MKITLNDGTVLNCLNITGNRDYIKGANRECIILAFDVTEVTYDELGKLFRNESATSSIFVDEGDTKYEYVDYTMFNGVVIKDDVIAAETNVTAETVKTVINVSMSQKTYTEKKFDNADEQLNALSEVVADMLGGAL